MAPTFIKLLRDGVPRPFLRASVRRFGRAAVSDSTAPTLLILGTRGVPASHGGLETFAERFALHMVSRGWNVTVYCQRDVPDHSPLDGKLDIDQWRGIRRVSISGSGKAPLS